MVALSQSSADRHPAILSYGFRPFFLVGATYAAVAILVWLPFFFGRIEIPTIFSPIDWHVHEMLYGYLPAIITGFLLTAIPSWTGRLPLRGGLLVLLIAIWLAGRLAIAFSIAIGPVAAAVIDLLFLATVTATAAREVLAARQWRNLAPIAILVAFIVGDVIFHVEADGDGSAELGKRIGIAATVALIALIGGRVIPSFTRNWLVRENPGRLPAPSGGFDAAASTIAILALLLWITLPNLVATGAMMLLACVAQAIRLGRWAGDRTLRDGLLLILHIGYAFIPLGFLLLGGAILLPRDIPVGAGIHAWTAGAIGVMTLAMMTRVSLGHTGRPTRAGSMTVAIYAAILVAALVRIGAAFEPRWSFVLLQIAGGAWVVAFFVFAVGYGPLLARPRVDRPSL